MEQIHFDAALDGGTGLNGFATTASRGNQSAPSGMESFREAIAIDRLNSHSTKRNWLNPEKSTEKSYLRV
ncbi:hypothetical protein NDI44_05815 [Trichocoleus sp. DQ-A3]|uniref:hypothetical protein n=1 Tax=Cyanophyceae TaxID=3028117 RepID=UPI0016835F76|nr:hypothetical protein [Coleofasciculus sp. FACHB-125]MBD1901191.1 hypothetical protein [Coleofasciculus sp. FACHB-125]